MNLRRGNCPSRAQGGGPGHSGARRWFWTGEGGPGLRKGVLEQGDDPGDECSELGNSLACGEQELTPLLDKQTLVGQECGCKLMVFEK